MLHSCRHKLIDAFSGTLRTLRPDAFIFQAVFLCEQAIEVGERMISQKLPWLERLVAHLAEGGLPAEEAGKLADMLASEPLIERIQLSCLDGDDWRDLGPSLHFAGLLDRLEIDGETWRSPTLPK